MLIPQRFFSLHAISYGLFLRVLRFLALLGCLTVCASGLTVKWSPNPESDIAGYKVHYGTYSEDLTEILDVGNATSCVLDRLAPETKYYFAVVAYNTVGLHSALSDRITFTTHPQGYIPVERSVYYAQILYGLVNPGAISEARTLTFTNTGTDTLTNVSFAIAGAAAGDFRIVEDSSPGSILASSLAPGKSITFGIAFSPGGGGLREAVLKLTADQSESALFEATLRGNGSVLFEPWLNSNGAAGGANGNPDGDALNNLLEYAFGTNPTAAQCTTVAAGAGGQLASRGAPGVRVQNTPAFQFLGLFARRKDHAKVGLIYKTQFSADLKVWADSTATPVVDGGDDEIEAVSVSAPATINGQTPRFFRVAVLQEGKLSMPAWLAAHGASGETTGNSDGDGLNNLFEFAFGTDPTVEQSNVTSEVSGRVASRGAPTARIVTVPGFQFNGLFCRRKDRDSKGLVYTPQFSHNLRLWVDSPYPSVVRADDGEIEVVSVQAPNSINDMPARFFRVAVSIAP
jgi:hypothetical protein